MNKIFIGIIAGLLLISYFLFNQNSSLKNENNSLRTTTETHKKEIDFFQREIEETLEKNKTQQAILDQLSNQPIGECASGEDLSKIDNKPLSNSFIDSYNKLRSPGGNR